MPNVDRRSPTGPGADRSDADLLHAMVQSSRSLHLYWKVGSRRRRLAELHFGCSWEALPKIVRVYDTTSVYFDGHNANGFFDIETSPDAEKLYINVQPGTTYAADYGTYTIRRQFVPFLRSNYVATPRSSVPDAAEPGGGPASFMTYAQAVRKGVYLNDESEGEEPFRGRKLRISDADPPPASALYPPS